MSTTVSSATRCDWHYRSGLTPAQRARADALDPMLTELAKRIDDEVGGFQIEVPCCLMAPLIECASNANRALTIFPSRVDAPHKHTIQVFHKRFMEEKKS